MSPSTDSKPGYGSDLVGGLAVGVLAFVAVFLAATGLELYDLRLLGRALGGEFGSMALVNGGFRMFNAAHLGASRRPLVLVGPTSPLRRVPGVLPYLVPLVALALAGGVRAWTGPRRSRWRAGVAGASLAVGYTVGVLLVLTALYLQVPFPLSPAFRTVLVAGVVYPVLFGGAGGVLAWRLTAPDGGRSAGRAPGTGRTTGDGGGWGTAGVSGERDVGRGTDDVSAGEGGWGAGPSPGEASAREAGPAADATATDATASDDTEIEGNVPGVSVAREKRGLVVVVLFAVGMIGAITLFGRLGVVAVVGVLGALFVAAGVNAWRRERHELATFEPTTGTVLATESRDATDNQQRPLVKYEYTVEGRRHENDKLWPGSPMGKRMGKERSEAFLSRYPEGEDITVHYDPADPSNAFLIRESHRHWFALVTLVGLALLGYTALVFLGAAQPPQPEPRY